jgi:hypothetical protein
VINYLSRIYEQNKLKAEPMQDQYFKETPSEKDLVAIANAYSMA